jgi:phospholipid-transporting ATPase
MGKDFYEDYFRHKADKVENQRQCKVVQNLSTATVAWEDIRVGQVILMKNRDLIPADLVLLATSDKDSLVFNMTANLDGETNLKTRQVASGLDKALPKVSSKNSNTVPLESASNLQGSVECELPNKNIHRFEGTFRTPDGQSFALGPKNILLRGTQVRNCQWVLGVVMYTGPQTKIMMNMISPPVKESKLHRATNKLTIHMFVSLSLWCLTAAAIGVNWNESDTVQVSDNQNKMA